MGVEVHWAECKGRTFAHLKSAAKTRQDIGEAAIVPVDIAALASEIERVVEWTRSEQSFEEAQRPGYRLLLLSSLRSVHAKLAELLWRNR